MWNHQNPNSTGYWLGGRSTAFVNPKNPSSSGAITTGTNAGEKILMKVSGWIRTGASAPIIIPSLTTNDASVGPSIIYTGSFLNIRPMGSTSVNFIGDAS